MKSKLLFTVPLALLLASLLGCGKHAEVSSGASTEQTFNAVQYCENFATASPELRTLANQAWMSIQAGAFSKAEKELGQLAANPALNEAQKKSTADLTAQLKKQMELRAAP